MMSLGKNHAPGTLLFQAPDGWTAADPAYAATAPLEDCQPFGPCIVRRILEKQGRYHRAPKQDERQLRIL